jgi:hypothetical protein
MQPGVDAGLRSEYGRTRWVRPGRPLFDPDGYDVQPCREAVARQLVETHHYSHSWVNALRCYALYHGPFAVGAVAFSRPMNDATLTNPFSELVLDDEVAELGRVVLLPGAAFNALSWTLSRVFELERRRGLLALVAFSDPVPRKTLSGRAVLPGHRGITYGALLGAYAGRSRRRRLIVLPDATSIPERAFQKVIAYEKGWGGVVKRLQRAGVPAPPDGDRHAWGLAVRTLLRGLDHGGNHKFLFALHPAMRSYFPSPALAYPKEIDVAEELDVA